MSDLFHRLAELGFQGPARTLRWTKPDGKEESKAHYDKLCYRYDRCQECRQITECWWWKQRWVCDVCAVSLILGIPRQLIEESILGEASKDSNIGSLSQ